jgi:hypothetical protein
MVPTLHMPRARALIVKVAAERGGQRHPWREISKFLAVNNKT